MWWRNSGFILISPCIQHRCRENGCPDVAWLSHLKPPLPAETLLRRIKMFKLF